MYMSEAAHKVMVDGIVDVLIPELNRLVKDVSESALIEDSPNRKDKFLRDYISQTVIKELAEFLVQAGLPEEDWAPIIRPSQLRRKYAKAWWK